MNLKMFLEGTGLFDVVQEDGEVCVGRARDLRLWAEYFQKLIIIDKHLSDQEGVDLTLRVSKEYYPTDNGSVAFLWIVACSNVDRLAKAAPPVEKAEWAEQFKKDGAGIKIQNGIPVGEIPLVSQPGSVKYPHPDDAPHIHDMSGN